MSQHEVESRITCLVQHSSNTNSQKVISYWSLHALPSKEVNDARQPHTCRQAVCVRRKTEKTPSPAAPKTHHEIHSSPATVTTSRWRATKDVPRISPYSPASIDPQFVAIGLVQLSQSVKTTNVTHTQTDRQTNSYSCNATLYAPRY